MVYQPEEASRVLEVIVSAMKNKGVLDRRENRSDFDLLTQTGRQDLVQEIADGLGLRIETDPASRLAIYFFPKENDSMFSVTKSDVRKMMMRSISSKESPADQCNGIAAQSCIFCYIVHFFFSSDLAPDYVQQDQVEIRDLMAGLDKYFSSLEQNDKDSALEPTPIENAAFYYHNRKEIADGMAIDNERTRVQSQLDLVKNVLRILEEYGMLDSAALKKSVVRPTRRFACWYGTGLAASSALPEIEQLFIDDGMDR